MSTNVRRMVIFEGPAGSGKTTALRAMEGWLPDRVTSPIDLPEFKRPRAYEGIEGILLSQLKDFRTILSVLGNDTDKAMLVDRWYISQWVYGSIRSGEHYLDQSKGRELLNSAWFTARAATWETRARSENWPKFGLLDIFYVFVVPSDDIIAQLRSNDEFLGRSYPYNARQEAEFYRQAADFIRKYPQPADDIRVKSCILQPNSAAGLGYLHYSISEHILSWLSDAYNPHPLPVIGSHGYVPRRRDTNSTALGSIPAPEPVGPFTVTRSDELAKTIPRENVVAPPADTEAPYLEPDIRVPPKMRGADYHASPPVRPRDDGDAGLVRGLETT